MYTNFPLVSIGIPTYNRPDGLKKVLECILNQTYKNIEIIISDNASEDKMVDQIVNDHMSSDSRIKFFKQKKNIGLYPNFEFVLNQAEGKYFMWAADDDEFSPVTIEKSVTGFFENDTAVVSSLACNIINSADGSIAQPIFIPHTIHCTNYIKFKKVIDYMFHEINIYFYGLIELEALRKCKFFKHDIYGADAFLLLELVEFGDITIDTSDVGIKYYLHPSQASATAEKLLKSNKLNLSFWKRQFFFSKYLFYYLRIIGKSKLLKASEKNNLCLYAIKKWFTTNKYHLVKYDLRLHKPIKWLKKMMK